MRALRVLNPREKRFMASTPEKPLSHQTDTAAGTTSMKFEVKGDSEVLYHTTYRRHPAGLDGTK